MNRAVVLFSGGIASWGAAKRARERFDDLTLLFTDTLMEDEDLYRFLGEAAENVGAPLVRIQDGRTPWQVFRDVRMIGNTRIDPCSRILKRELARTWLEEHRDPADTVIVLGFDWSELHRAERAVKHWEPWQIWSPLTEKPYTWRPDLFAALAEAGIDPPRLYGMGFSHNNCGGFCVKAGQGHFAMLLHAMPERYAEHEREEEAMRQYLGKDVAILRDRGGGDTKPMTLRALRERIQCGDQIDMFDLGGCGCFDPGDDVAVDEDVLA